MVRTAKRPDAGRVFRAWTLLLQGHCVSLDIATDVKIRYGRKLHLRWNKKQTWA